MAVELREATAADAGAAFALTRAGFETYRFFAPAGWEPPHKSVAELRGRLAAPGVWGVMGEEGGAAVGFGAFEPTREEAGARDGPHVPGLAHVFAIFVAESPWGTGLAATILDAVVNRIRADRFTEGRLFTPAVRSAPNVPFAHLWVGELHVRPAPVRREPRGALRAATRPSSPSWGPAAARP